MSSINHPEFKRVGKYALDTLGGFKSFILRGNVVDLAIGIVIGAAFTSVVNSLVKDVITPLIPIYQGNLSDATWAVPWTKNGLLHYGSFINAIISFLLIAVVLYFFIVRPVSVIMDRYKPQKIEKSTQDCPYCLQSVPEQATRCAYCTSQLPPVEQKEMIRV